MAEKLRLEGKYSGGDVRISEILNHMADSETRLDSLENWSPAGKNGEVRPETEEKLGLAGRNTAEPNLNY